MKRFAILLALGVLLTLLFAAGAPAQTTQTVTLSPLGETDIDQRYPNTNYASASTLNVDGDTGSGYDRYSIMRFDVSQIPQGSTIQSVRLYADIQNTSTQTYPMYALKRGWVEGQATWRVYASGLYWQTAGARGADDRDASAFGEFWGKWAGTQYSDFGSAGVGLVQSWVDGTRRNDGFVIASSTNYDGIDYANPRLEVTYAPPPSKLVTGIYEGYHDPAGVDSFYAWLGYTGERYAHEFVDHRYGMGTIGNCLWQGWADWVNVDDANRRFTLSLPLLSTDVAGDFAGINSGKYDSYFQQCANQLKAGGGTKDAIIRLGWEANGNSFPWRIDVDGGSGSATQAEVDQYKAAFQRIVNVMRAANPDLKVEWEMNVTLDDAGYPLETLYPGDAYVDYIGLAVYDYCIIGCTSNTVDGRWNNLMEPEPRGGANNGLRYHAEFAASRVKPINFTEYGLWPVNRSPGGGGDNPTFITRMADWMRQKGAVYHIYNEGHGEHSLNNYPNSKTEYKNQFGR